jgi:hypothetical protein
LERDILRMLRNFPITDAIEGAIEVRLELSDALRAQRSRVWLLLTCLVLGVLLSIVSAFWQVGEFAGGIFSFIDGDVEWGVRELALGIVLFMISLLVLALGTSDLLFAYQMRKFFAMMRARYGILEAGRVGGADHHQATRQDISRAEDESRVDDPARSLLGLAREGEGEIPQVDNLLKYCTVFTFMLAVIMLGLVGLTVLGASFAQEDQWTELAALHLVAMAFLSVSVLLLIETNRFVQYFKARIRALEVFEAQGPIPVPMGDTPLDRLAVLMQATGMSDGPERGPETLKGASGSDHSFDLVLGDAGDRVLVRKYGSIPGIEELRDLRAAAEDVAKNDGALPLRIVALVDVEIDDLDVEEIVYDFLMEHPIMDDLGERARSLQIVAEVEGHYSVLPFTVP